VKLSNVEVGRGKTFRTEGEKTRGEKGSLKNIWINGVSKNLPFRIRGMQGGKKQRMSKGKAGKAGVGSQKMAFVHNYRIAWEVP